MARAPIEVEVKSVTLRGETRYSWWASVDRHPYSDKQGYASEAEALQAVGAWVATYYPDREFVLKGSADA